MMKRNQAIVATETTEQLHDDEGRNCRGLLFSIIQRAVDDVAIEQRRERALRYICSSDFIFLAELLSLDAEAIKAKLVPLDFSVSHARQIEKVFIAPTIRVPEPAAVQGASAEQFMAGKSPEEEFAAFVATRTLQELESSYGY